MWEFLTLEMPYRDFEQSTIIYGVGNSTLSLPVPKTFPKGYSLLMEMCWKTTPRNRPSFQQILTHIEIATREFNDIPLDVYQQRQVDWRVEVARKLCQTRNSINNSLSSSSQVENGSKQDLCEEASKNPNGGASLCKVLKEKERIAKKLNKIKEEQCEKMFKKNVQLYRDLVQALQAVEQREADLEKRAINSSLGSSSAGNTNTRRRPKSSRGGQRKVASLLANAQNDPLYQSALELSRPTQSSESDSGDAPKEEPRCTTNNVVSQTKCECRKLLTLSMQMPFAKSIRDSPVRHSSGGGQQGSVRLRLKRYRNRKVSSSRTDSAAITGVSSEFSIDASLELGEMEPPPPPVPIDASQVATVGASITTTAEQSFDDETSGAQGGRLVRNAFRRTLDSGYGDTQSCDLSPVTEPKKLLANDTRGSANPIRHMVSQSSKESNSTSSGQSVRKACRLRRQKAFDGRVSSAQSQRLRSASQPAAGEQRLRSPTLSSSSDCEENDEEEVLEEFHKDPVMIRIRSGGRRPPLVAGRGEPVLQMKMKTSKLCRKASMVVSSSSSSDIDGDEVNSDSDDNTMERWAKTTSQRRRQQQLKL